MNRSEVLLDVEKKITVDRAATHGEAISQLANSQEFKRLAREGRNWHNLNGTVQEAIDNILQKVSRLTNGSYHDDHLADIIGYAAIAVESMDPGKAIPGLQVSFGPRGPNAFPEVLPGTSPDRVARGIVEGEDN